MKTQNLIENYMSQLDQYLSHIPATEKAEIILELNAHIQDTLSNSEKSTEEVLNSLGTPEETAKRYLEERGLSLSPNRMTLPRNDTGKWLTIAFLGTIGLFMAFSIFVMLFFSPLVEVKEEEGKVRILGGLINVQEDLTKRAKKNKPKGIRHKDQTVDIEITTDESEKSAIQIKGDGENIEIKANGFESLKELKELKKLKKLKKLKNLDDDIVGDEVEDEIEDKVEE